MSAFKKSFVFIATGLIVIGVIAIIFGAAFGGLTNGMFSSGTDNKTYEYSDTEITSIYIEIDAGNVQIKPGSEFKIVTDNIHSSNLKSNVDSGIWSIEYTPRNSIGFGNFSFGSIGFNMRESDIIIYVPNDALLEKVELKFGAGNFEIESLTVDELILKVGAGNVDIEDTIANYASIDAGVGKVSFEGEIKNDADIKCGVGKVELDLDGNYEDYNYEIKVGIGSAKINNDSYSGIGEKTINHNDAIGKFTIDCGIGEVVIKIS